MMIKIVHCITEVQNVERIKRELLTHMKHHLKGPEPHVVIAREDQSAGEVEAVYKQLQPDLLLIPIAHISAHRILPEMPKILICPDPSLRYDYMGRVLESYGESRINAVNRAYTTIAALTNEKKLTYSKIINQSLGEFVDAAIYYLD